ncbi:hypothetical protein QN344_03030, partial [Mucilaginibacter sp. 5B2]|nr:hypothetical protein [Mucilaginibacter sp. 5B2]
IGGCKQAVLFNKINKAFNRKHTSKLNIRLSLPSSKERVQKEKKSKSSLLERILGEAKIVIKIINLITPAKN